MKIIKPGIANDGSTIMVVRLSEPWDSRRYLTQDEMKLKKSDFPEDTIFITEGKTKGIRKIWERFVAAKNKLIDNVMHVNNP